MTIEAVDALAPARSVKLITFDKVQVVPGIVNDTWFLIVSGTAPCLNMQVSLSPLIYVTCPDYWGIEVIGSLPGGMCLTVIKPFVLTLPLAGITGSQGVEVIGANGSEQIRVAGGCVPI